MHLVWLLLVSVDPFFAHHFLFGLVAFGFADSVLVAFGFSDSVLVALGSADSVLVALSLVALVLVVGQFV